jgi:hypothetical protein
MLVTATLLTDSVDFGEFFSVIFTTFSRNEVTYADIYIMIKPMLAFSPMYVPLFRYVCVLFGAGWYRIAETTVIERRR